MGRKKERIMGIGSMRSGIWETRKNPWGETGILISTQIRTRALVRAPGNSGKLVLQGT